MMVPPYQNAALILEPLADPLNPTQFIGLLGFGFNSIWMLAWIAGAAVPIMLHLLNQRSSGTIRWAAMRLLQQVIEKESKRIRFEQLILLLIRTLIFAVLAFALARPFLGSLSANSITDGNQPPRLWIFVVDCSYSMNYISAGRSRLAEAKESLLELVSQAGENDAFTLVALSDPSRAVIREPTFNRERVKAAIESLTTSDLGADLASAFGQVDAIVRSASRLTDIPQQTAVDVYSDMGIDTWNAAIDFKSLVDSLPESVTVDVHSLATESPANTSVTELRAVPTASQSGQSFRADAVLRQVNGVNKSTVEVSLLVDGVPNQTLQAEIPANGTTRVSFDFEINNPGNYGLTVQLPDDRLANDNQRHLVLTSRRTTRVLFIEDSDGASRVLQLAAGISLETSVTGNPPPFTAETISPLQIAGRNLARHDMIVCCDLSYVSEDFLSQLQDYVSQGGSLLVCFGENTRAAQWISGSTLVGFELTEPSQIGDWKIDPLEYASSIAKPFQGFPESGLLTTPIFRYWRTDQSDPTLRTELGIRNAGPLVTMYSLDQGNVAALLSAPAESESTTQRRNRLDSLAEANDTESWNALPTWPSFVPLVRELFQALLDAKQESFNLRCGEFLRGVSNQLAPFEVSVASPNNSVTSVRSEATASGTQQWFFSRTQDSGLYRVASDAKETKELNKSTAIFALNLDSRQGELISAPAPVVRPRGPMDLEATNFAGAGSQDRFSLLSRYGLGALLLLLCLESLLAWRFGRRLR